MSQLTYHPTHPPTHLSTRPPTLSSLTLHRPRLSNKPRATLNQPIDRASEQERVRWRWPQRRSGGSGDGGGGGRDDRSSGADTTACNAVAQGLMRFLDTHLLRSKAERTTEERSFSGGGEEEKRTRHRRYSAEMHDAVLGGTYPCGVIFLDGQRGRGGGGQCRYMAVSRCTPDGPYPRIVPASITATCFVGEVAPHHPTLVAVGFF